MQEFFDGIETNPLTPEQRLSVVTDADATLVLAGAGSGKTSVIVAKAAYLIKRNVRQPEEILLMAFGAKAAEEMATRIEERCGASVDALTFHALRKRAATGGHESDKLCSELDIEHRLTPPRSLQTNGMVERFNGRIEDVLQSHHFRSGKELEATLHRYAWLYNQHSHNQH